jgi:hypothetical protein
MTLTETPSRTVVPAKPVDAFSPQNRLTVARLNRIATLTGARRYLEVGVFKGQTFLNLNFAEMHAVDPAFLFDTGPEGRANRQFFKQTSDQFFASRPDSKPYDLIYLDGFHTFEQTFRDLCAAQVLSHAGTVIVLDDTVPSDMFSMMRDQAECNRMRRQHGVVGRSWHGDVCKVVFAIHDFFPNLDYRTISDAGNPQTVVIRRPRAAFKPKWNSLEAISRLDYASFQANRGLMQDIAEKDLADWIKPAKT